MLFRDEAQIRAISTRYDPVAEVGSAPGSHYPHGERRRVARQLARHWSGFKAIAALQ
jgi:hypothetical protein